MHPAGVVHLSLPLALGDLAGEIGPRYAVGKAPERRHGWMKK
jgi:hypothetical protein